MNDLKVQKKNHSVLKNLNTLYPGDIKRIYKMRGRFIELEKNTYEKRAFLYLDIISWQEAKSKTKNQNIMREKQN
jgi:hypothetical protein